MRQCSPTTQPPDPSAHSSTGTVNPGEGPPPLSPVGPVGRQPPNRTFGNNRRVSGEAASTGAGNTVRPPVLIASSARPSTVRWFDSSSAPTSSVWNQPGSPNGSGLGGLRYPFASVVPPIEMRPAHHRQWRRCVPAPRPGRPSYTQPPAVSLDPYVHHLIPARAARSRTGLGAGPPPSSTASVTQIGGGRGRQGPWPIDSPPVRCSAVRGPKGSPRPATGPGRIPSTRPKPPASSPTNGLRSTWMPAIWWAGRASSQAPGPPSR